jgi:hypothetical protein
MERSGERHGEVAVGGARGGDRTAGEVGDPCAEILGCEVETLGLIPCSSAQAYKASDASCHCIGFPAVPGGIGLSAAPAGSATNASRCAGSVRRLRSGISREATSYMMTDLFPLSRLTR